MKPVIKSKFKEAKQFNKNILKNIKESAVKSNILLSNQKKSKNNFEKSKKLFSNMKNLLNKTKYSKNEFIKAINNYIANPNSQNLKLINEKRNNLLYKINLNSNNSNALSNNFLILKNNMLESIKMAKEILPNLKSSKVNINKLNLTYLKINQLIKIKKNNKNLDNRKQKKIIRPIFRQDSPKPDCDEIRLLIVVEEGKIDDAIKELKKISLENYNLVISFENMRKKENETSSKIIDIEFDIEEAKKQDENYENIKHIDEIIKEINENIVRQFNIDKWKTPQERLIESIQIFNESQNEIKKQMEKIDELLDLLEANPSEKTEEDIKFHNERINELQKTSRSSENDINKFIALIKIFGTVSDKHDGIIQGIHDLTVQLEESKSKYTDYTLNFIKQKTNEIYNLKFELIDIRRFVRRNEDRVWKFKDENRDLFDQIIKSKNQIKNLNDIINNGDCDETTPNPV